MTEPLRRSDNEEFWNCLTHGIGFVLSLAGTAWAAPKFSSRPWPILIAVFVFLACLILVYGSSTLSHYCRSPKWLSFFRQLDQACIYLLIVASYSPFSIAYLDGWWWHFVLGGMWLLAITGFTSKLVFAHRVESVSISMYLLLGWIPFVSGMPFVGLVPTKTIGLIILGGIFYSGGTWFLFNDRRKWYFHSLWHVCVIAGSTTHFVAVYWLV